MKQQEALNAHEHLIDEYAHERGIEHGQIEAPSFSDYRDWVVDRGYSRYFDFRSEGGAAAAVEILFDRKLGQIWRN